MYGFVTMDVIVYRPVLIIHSLNQHAVMTELWEGLCVCVPN